MSSAEKAFGVIKSMMLMNERFDALDERAKENAREIVDLAKSHSELAQRVAVIEGYIRGRADQAAMQPRLPKD